MSEHLYTMFICPQCESPHDFAGACALCRDRPQLESVRVMRVDHIIAMREKYNVNEIRQFVDKLLGVDSN